LITPSRQKSTILNPTAAPKDSIPTPFIEAIERLLHGATTEQAAPLTPVRIAAAVEAA
jgi:hypothetical protein